MCGCRGEAFYWCCDLKPEDEMTCLVNNPSFLVQAAEEFRDLGYLYGELAGIR